MTRKQPQPEPPPDNGHAKAGQRPHREPGAAVTGHHADRPGDPRSGPNQAGLAWAASSGHDYTHCGPPPLPAWFYVLQGQPVPDDAPRTRPPTGFAELMAKRRGGNPDSDSPDSDSPDTTAQTAQPRQHSPDSDSPDSDSPDSDSPDSDSPDSDSPDSDSPDSDSPDSDSPDSAATSRCPPSGPARVRRPGRRHRGPGHRTRPRAARPASAQTPPRTASHG